MLSIINLIFFSLSNAINGLVIVIRGLNRGGEFSIISIIAFAKGPFLS
jgi:hypothetical protein